MLQSASLSHDPLGVLHSTCAVFLGAAELEEEVALKELDLAIAHASDLHLRLSTLAEDESGVVVGDLQGVDSVVAGFLLPPLISALASAAAAAAAAVLLAAGAALPAGAALAAPVATVVAAHR